ncbi:Zinc finger SWIM domain-containing protein 7 [Trichinella pseudospiralis]|uniref:Zinc finger SWIM domain-containing protein 7 n=1 Tax=Trichinella pseudospiralis TaxID=6337 RepID=A0A0V1FGL9_TRIPS|nr:Zinc finger SWIM domain-containing protein 7 [Trichinella pseudospiralis]
MQMAMIILHKKMETTISWRCVAEQLLDELQARYQSDGMIADEIMLAMSAVFDSRTVLESFNLVDRNSICRLLSSSGKILFQVVDQDDTAWLVLPKINYCKCEFFANEVVHGHFQICKHVLAVWLASAVGRLHYRSIDDKTMTAICGCCKAKVSVGNKLTWLNI